MSRPVDPGRVERNGRIVAQQRRIEAVVDAIADRLPAEKVARAHRLQRGGEHALALNGVLAWLSTTGPVISRDEHRALAEAVDYYEQPVEYLTFVSRDVVAALPVRDPDDGSGRGGGT